VTTNRRFSIVSRAVDGALDLRSLTELKTETPTPSEDANQNESGVPTLERVLTRIGSIPSEALFLGVASDGLPVLLNLYDSHPGPLLIAGDEGSGKTVFLRTIARAAAQTHRSEDVQFGIVTNYPDEWVSLEGTPYQAGVFPVGQNRTEGFIHSLAAWAHSNKDSRRCTLLLVDDLESVASLAPETVQDFRWLLLRGPARRVWPIVTLNAARYGQVISWLQNFRTRIFGRVANGRVAEALGADRTSGVAELQAQVQFTLREREDWLHFWLPSCL
jgi:hypothetical protein